MALKSPGDLLTVVLCNQSGIQLGGGRGLHIFLYLLSLFCQFESHSSSLGERPIFMNCQEPIGFLFC